MHYSLTKTIQPDHCLVVGVFQNKTIASDHFLTKEQQAQLQRILELGDFTAKIGSCTLHYFVTGFLQTRLILLGLGEQEKYSLTMARKAMAALGTVLVNQSIHAIDILLPRLAKEKDPLLVRQAIISLEDANIRRDQLKSKAAPFFWPDKIFLVGDFVGAEKALHEGKVISAGIKLEKQLGNSPANLCTPRDLARCAEEIGKSEANLTVKIHDEAAIKALKMGCFLGVAQGSVEPPRLIEMHYQGDAKSPPLVLVGKGVTFDTGGISLKPPLHMDAMKYDMCGAATVIAALQIVAQLKLPLNLVGLVAATENMPSGSAIKPGDVVTSMSGQTVEVLNTDAEGRLILCDMLTYAERFNPKAVIDIATLTGAIIMALGSVASGIMANNDELAAALLKAGEESGDRLWPLPIWEEYQELIDTAFADVANLGGDTAKAITAACFLARFAHKYPWAHLDIAGVAWQGSSNMNRAASGRPLPMLAHYLLTCCEQ